MVGNVLGGVDFIGKIVDLMTYEDAAANGVQMIGDHHGVKRLWPVVEFVSGKYVTVPTPKRVLVLPGEATVDNANDTMRATRYQVPLLLAW